MLKSFNTEIYPIKKFFYLKLIPWGKMKPSLDRQCSDFEHTNLFALEECAILQRRAEIAYKMYSIRFK